MDTVTDVQIQVLPLNGKDYILVDCLNQENTYYYFSNVKDFSDVLILKEYGDLLVLLEDQGELDLAFRLFYEKYKYRVNINGNAN